MFLVYTYIYTVLFKFSGSIHLEYVAAIYSSWFIYNTYEWLLIYLGTRNDRDITSDVTLSASYHYDCGSLLVSYL